MANSTLAESEISALYKQTGRTALTFITKAKRTAGCLLATCFLLVAHLTSGQKLLLPTTNGGESGGVVTQFNAASGTLSPVYTPQNVGNSPNQLIVGSDGKLYGIATGGGVSGLGTIFSIDRSSGVVSRLHSFDQMTGRFGADYFGYPRFRAIAPLVQATNGTMYGLTVRGGIADSGVLYSVNPTSGQYTRLKDFSGADGTYPNGSLARTSDGKLYGVSNTGGSTNEGVLFSYDPGTGAFSRLYNFHGATGVNPVGGLVKAANGKLYGRTAGGGQGNGVFFSFDPTASTYTVEKEIGYATVGYNTGALSLGANGVIYGLGTRGLFSFAPATGTFTVLYTFPSSYFVFGTPFLASNGKLYGFVSTGTASYANTLFSFDPTSSSYTEWQTDEGGVGMFVEKDGKLYSSSGQGISIVNTTTNTYTNFARVAGFTQGADAAGGLVATGNKFYGIMRDYGMNNSGVIYSIDTSSLAFKKELDLASALYASSGTLVRGANGQLYGTITTGGTNQRGSIFVFDPATAQATRLVDVGFGTAPATGLTLGNNGQLYGVTQNGGTSNFGLIFSFDPVSLSFNQYTSLSAVTGYSGSVPLLQASNGNLYGTTNSGGSGNNGTLFSFNPSTNIFEKLYDFSYSTGAAGSGKLTEGKGGKLYGTTASGGKYYYGVIYSFDPVGKVYTVLHDFDGVNGATPKGGLLSASDGKLYGTTSGGGANGLGVVFSFDPKTGIFTKVNDFNGSNGANPAFAFVENGAVSPADTVVTCSLNATAVSGVIACNGGSTSLTIKSSGGVTPYQYSVNDGAYTADNVLSVVAGVYKITVKDNKGCTVVLPNVAVQQPDPISLSIVAGKISCNGGTADVALTIGGGSLVYTATIAYNTTTKVTLKDIKPGTYSLPLPAGSYKFNVVDNRGCTLVRSLTITEPAAINTTVSASPIACAGGSTTAVVNATGGTPGYKYSINGGAFGNSNTFANLPAGTYTFIAKDTKGCTKKMNYTIADGMAGCSSIVAAKGTTSTESKVTVLVRPNPSASQFIINVSGSTATDTYIIVTDVTGRKVYQAKGGANKAFTFGSDLVPGMYLAKIITGANTRVLTLIKQKQ